MLKDMQCRLLVYKQHSMHWLRWADFITLFALSLHQRQVPTQTLSFYLSAVLCLSGNKNVWDLWGVNLLVWEGGGGGCQTLMNSGGFYLCIDTAK